MEARVWLREILKNSQLFIKVKHTIYKVKAKSERKILQYLSATIRPCGL